MTRASRRIASVVCVGMCLVWTDAIASTPAASPVTEEAGGTASTHAVETIEGWTVLINNALLKEHPEKTARAIELLRGQLAKIREVVPPAAVAHLQKVRLWFNPRYPNSGAPKAEYHPGAGWLRENGRDPAMEKCVEFTNLEIFERECRRMPMLALHELAHAYHDLVLSHRHPEIIAAYKRARKSGIYDEVERWTGEITNRAPAYAMSNPQEYFAETSEAYFGRNDFQPFEREELKQMDPEMYALLERLWEVR